MMAWIYLLLTVELDGGVTVGLEMAWPAKSVHSQGGV